MSHDDSFWGDHLLFRLAILMIGFALWFLIRAQFDVADGVYIAGCFIWGFISDLVAGAIRRRLS